MQRMKLTLAAFVVGLSDQLALAADPFDGRWRLSIEVESGPCVQPLLAYLVIISRSQVSLDPLTSMTTGADLYGTVDPEGFVVASVQRGTDTADGTGTIKGTLGKGRWHHEDCKGTWILKRR